MTSVWDELKRRNVIKVTIAYVIVAWLLLQVSETLISCRRKLIAPELLAIHFSFG